MTDATEKTEQAEQSEQPAVSPKRRTIGEHLAVVTAIWLVIALILEWGYWHGFGISLEEIPLSVQYLLDAALVWSLEFFAAVVIYFVYELALFKFEGRSFEDDTFPPLAFPESRDFIRPSFWGQIIFPLILVFQLWKTGTVNFIVLGFTFIICSYFLVRIGLNKGDVLPLIKREPEIVLCTLLPAFFALIAMFGFWSALQDSKNISDLASVQLQKGSPRSMVILRNTGEHIIAYDIRAQKVAIIPQKAVQELSFPSAPDWNVEFFETDENGEKDEK